MPIKRSLRQKLNREMLELNQKDIADTDKTFKKNGHKQRHITHCHFQLIMVTNEKVIVKGVSMQIQTNHKGNLILSSRCQIQNKINDV